MSSHLSQAPVRQAAWPSCLWQQTAFTHIRAVFQTATVMASITSAMLSSRSTDAAVCCYGCSWQLPRPAAAGEIVEQELKHTYSTMQQAQIHHEGILCAVESRCHVFKSQTDRLTPGMQFVVKGARGNYPVQLQQVRSLSRNRTIRIPQCSKPNSP